MFAEERSAYGCHTLGVETDDLDAVIAALKAGFPYSAFEALWQSVGIPQKKLAEVANINQRTLSRRKREMRFHADESERLLRVGRVVERAIELMDGDSEAAAAWLMKPSRALGGKTPLDYADTEPGAREVMGLIGRLEHGVFS